MPVGSIGPTRNVLGRMRDLLCVDADRYRKRAEFQSDGEVGAGHLAGSVGRPAGSADLTPRAAARCEIVCARRDVGVVGAEGASRSEAAFVLVRAPVRSPSGPIAANVSGPGDVPLGVDGIGLRCLSKRDGVVLNWPAYRLSPRYPAREIAAALTVTVCAEELGSPHVLADGRPPALLIPPIVHGWGGMVPRGRVGAGGGQRGACGMTGSR